MWDVLQRETLLWYSDTLWLLLSGVDYLTRQMSSVDVGVIQSWTCSWDSLLIKLCLPSVRPSSLNQQFSDWGLVTAWWPCDHMTMWPYLDPCRTGRWGQRGRSSSAAAGRRIWLKTCRRGRGRPDGGERCWFVTRSQPERKHTNTQTHKHTTAPERWDAAGGSAASSAQHLKLSSSWSKWEPGVRDINLSCSRISC